MHLQMITRAWMFLIASRIVLNLLTTNLISLNVVRRKRISNWLGELQAHQCGNLLGWPPRGCGRGRGKGRNKVRDRSARERVRKNRDRVMSTA
jgi:hypothetical protein